MHLLCDEFFHQLGDSCIEYHHQVGCLAFGQCDELVFDHMVVVFKKVSQNFNQLILVFVFPFHNTIDLANGWGGSMGRNMLAGGLAWSGKKKRHL